MTPVEGLIESVRCWELQTADSGMPEVEACTVKERLGKCIPFWREELCAPPWVIDTITEGYVLPLMSESPPYSRPNQHSAQLESKFVSKADIDLVAEGYVERSAKAPTECSSLSVVVNGTGKKRLVVNLRHVNQSKSLEAEVLI